MANFPKLGDPVDGMVPVTLPDGRTVNLPAPIAQKAYPSLFAAPIQPSVPVPPIPLTPPTYAPPTPEEEAQAAEYARVARGDTTPEEDAAAKAQTEATLNAYGITSPKSPSHTPADMAANVAAPRKATFLGAELPMTLDIQPGGGQPAPEPATMPHMGGSSGEGYSVSGPVEVPVNEFDGVISDQKAARDKIAGASRGQAGAADIRYAVATGRMPPSAEHPEGEQIMPEGADALEARYGLQSDEIDKQYLAAEQAARAAADEQIAIDRQRVQDRLTEVGMVDPRKTFHDRSNFDNLMGFMAVGLGALAGVRDGSGKNQGLEQVNKVIERDIKAQEFNIATAQWKTGEARTDMADHERYRLSAKAWRLEELGLRKAALSNQLKAEMAKFKSPIRQAEYMEAIAKIDADGGKNLMDADAIRERAINDLVDAKWKNASLAESARRADLEAQSKVKPPLVMAHPTKVGVRIPVDPQLAGQFTETQQGEWKKETAFRFDMQRRINKIRALAHEQGATFGPGANWAALSNEKKALLTAEFTKLQEALLRAATGAAAPEAEVERYQQMLGNRETWLSVDPDLKLQSLSGDLAFQQTSRSRVQGLAPYDWDSDFKLDEFKSQPPVTTKTYTDRYFGYRKGIESGAGGDSTIKDAVNGLPEAIKHATTSKDSTPQEVQLLATQLRELSRQAKARGNTEAAKKLAAAAVKLTKSVAEKKKAYDEAVKTGEGSGYEGFVP